METKYTMQKTEVSIEVNGIITLYENHPSWKILILVQFHGLLIAVKLIKEVVDPLPKSVHHF